MISTTYQSISKENNTIYIYLDESEPSVSTISTESQSREGRLAKMTFIGILAVLVVITFTIIAIIIVRIIRRQRANENVAKTELSQRPSSSHTSTACMSESTSRSYYEPQLSADESINNNLSLSRLNSNHRPRLSRRAENRAPIHVCPRCCTHAEYYMCEYNNGCHSDGRRNNDSYYEPTEENTKSLNRTQRVHSSIERRLSGASYLSDEDFPHRNYPTYL